MAVLLKGPPELVEQRGPGRSSARSERIDGVDVLSPWAIGGARVLREPPGEALLTLQVRKPLREIFDETTPAVERTLERDVPPAMQRRADRPGAADARDQRRRRSTRSTRAS